MMEATAMSDTIYDDIRRLLESSRIFRPGKVSAPGTLIYAPHPGVMKPELMSMGDAPIIHTCSCGRTYTREEWEKLKYVGLADQDVEGDRLREMRNCYCGSTRSAPRVLPANT